MYLKAGSRALNPTTGSTWEVIEGEVETEGRGFTLEVVCLPGSEPDVLEHVHTSWTESFEIVSGKARYQVAGEERDASTGDTITLPPNKPHIHPWNIGNKKLVYRQKATFETPSQEAFQEVVGTFFTLFGMAGEGKVNAKGLPRNPLQFAATLKTLVKNGGYDAQVPKFAQDLVAGTLGRLAENCGYRAVDPRYIESP